MTSSSEYRLKDAPRTYVTIVDLLFVTMALALAALVCLVYCAIAGILLTGFGIVVTVVLLLASLAIVHLLRRRNRQHPDWEAYHEKRLPTKQNAPLLQSELVLPVSSSVRVMHRFEYLVTVFFILCGLALTVSFCLTAFEHWELLFFGLFFILVCCFHLRRLLRISRSDNSNLSVRADEKGITIPMAILEMVAADQLAKQGGKEQLLGWDEIQEWEVNSGSSDDAPMYLIKLTNDRDLSVYRSALIGREIQLLEYIRAAGVPVLLKDSVVA